MENKVLLFLCAIYLISDLVVMKRYEHITILNLLFLIFDCICILYIASEIFFWFTKKRFIEIKANLKISRGDKDTTEED